MKQSILISFLITIFLFSCRKEDNPNLPDLIRVPQPQITKDASGDGTISRDNPLGFQGKFIVDVYFDIDVKPQKFDIVAIKNDDKSKIVTIQQNVTTFPTTVNVTGQQLTDLFGEPIVLGDKFTIGANVTTQSGQLIEAFPKNATAFGSGVINQPGASPTINYIAVCPFNFDAFLGQVTVEDPGFWGDYSATITKESDDTWRVSGWVESPTYSFLIKVNAATQTVTIAKQVYGPTLPTTSFTNPAVEGNGTVNACTTEMTLRITNTVTQGSFGTTTVVLKK